MSKVELRRADHPEHSPREPREVHESATRPYSDHDLDDEQYEYSFYPSKLSNMHVAALLDAYAIYECVL